jgi:hypothetical protein
MVQRPGHLALAPEGYIPARNLVFYAIAANVAESRGARRIVGIDFAPEMVRLAEEHARRAGVADRCEFQVTTFPASGPAGPFDASTAMGYFDYIADPVPSLRRMREITTRTMIMSFPKSCEWRVPVRRLRFKLAGCPLYLYSKARVERLLSDAGIGRYEIVFLDRDYVVVAHA